MKTHYLGAIAIAGLLTTGTVACDGVNPCAGVTEQQGDPCAADPCAADPCAADPCAAN